MFSSIDKRRPCQKSRTRKSFITVISRSLKLMHVERKACPWGVPGPTRKECCRKRQQLTMRVRQAYHFSFARMTTHIAIPVRFPLPSVRAEYRKLSPVLVWETSRFKRIQLISGVLMELNGTEYRRHSQGFQDYHEPPLLMIVRRTITGEMYLMFRNIVQCAVRDVQLNIQL